MKNYDYKKKEYTTYTGTTTDKISMNDLKKWYDSGTGCVTYTTSDSTWTNPYKNEGTAEQEPSKINTNEMVKAWKDINDRIELNTTQRKNRAKKDQELNNKLLNELNAIHQYTFPVLQPLPSSSKPRRIKTKAVLVEREIEDDDDLTLIR
jgi:hypothetical protein